MDKLLLYIILVLMQICSILVIQMMIFVEMDKTGIFSMVLRYCQTLQKLISLFCLILLVNFDQTFGEIVLGLAQVYDYSDSTVASVPFLTVLVALLYNPSLAQFPRVIHVIYFGENTS